LISKKEVNGMGRHRIEADKPFVVRLTTNQRAKLEYYCKSKEISLAEGLRELVRKLPSPPTQAESEKISNSNNSKN
jgi:hypothetical protein